MSTKKQQYPLTGMEFCAVDNQGNVQATGSVLSSRNGVFVLQVDGPAPYKLVRSPETMGDILLFDTHQALGVFIHFIHTRNQAQNPPTVEDLQGVEEEAAEILAGLDEDQLGDSPLDEGLSYREPIEAEDTDNPSVA